MDWGAIMLIAQVIVAAETSPDSPRLLVDLLDVQWWQWLGMVLGALGLSPLPWIGGLAAGKIQFSAVAQKAHDEQVQRLEEAHKRELDARNAYHKGLMDAAEQRYADSQEAARVNAAAAERNKERADQVTDALLDLGQFIQGTQHFMESALEAGQKEVTERGT